MKFARDLFEKHVVPAVEKAIHHGVEIGKTVLGVALTAAGLAVVGGAVAAVAAAAEWSIIVKVILFVPAALGAFLLVMSLAEAFAKDDYTNKARLQRCAVAGAVCAAIPLALAGGMFGIAVPLAALTLFAVVMVVYLARSVDPRLEPMALNRILPAAVGGDAATAG